MTEVIYLADRKDGEELRAVELHEIERELEEESDGWSIDNKLEDIPQEIREHAEQIRNEKENSDRFYENVVRYEIEGEGEAYLFRTEKGYVIASEEGLPDALPNEDSPDELYFDPQ